MVKRCFSFNLVGRDSTTHFSSLKGTLKTNHFCFLCIAAPDSKDLHEHAAYCLTRVDPLTWNPSMYCFILLKYLPPSKYYYNNVGIGAFIDQT